MDNDDTSITSNNTAQSTNTTSDTNSPVNISSIIEDNSGGLSATRVLMLSWGIGVLVIWGFGAVMATLHGLPFPVLPDNIVTLTLGILGGKVIQRFGEK